MKILICGLPGTGKTTLTKTIGEQFNIKTISDWDIFYQWEIKIDKFEDKKNVSKKYSKLLMEEIFKFDNIVVDLEYSISPKDFIDLNCKECTIVYLGFIKENETDLFNLFRQSSSNLKYTDKELKEKVSFYKQMSYNYKKECEKYDLKFFDVNKDRKTLLIEILSFLKVAINK